MSRVIAYLNSSFWAMRPAEFASMMRIAYAHTATLDSILAEAEESAKRTQAMLAVRGERLSGTRYVEMREGNVAVIDLNGAIAKRMSLFQEICYGGVSTETLLRDFNTALGSEGVSSIIFNIDSPGGEAFGINEMAQAIFEARGKKPVSAYVSGLGCSGAYWIASACEEIVCDKSAFLGSIGVVTAWMDDKEFYKGMGIRREVVTSSNAKFKRLDFDNEEHRTELQRELDSLEKVFHKAVARNRKITIAEVIEDFNHGGVLSGLDAVKAGMADRVGNLEALIREHSKKNRKKQSMGADFGTGEFDMGFKEEFKSFAAKLGFKVSEEKQEENPATEEAAEAAADTRDLRAEKERADKAERELAELKAEKEKEFSEQVEREADAFISAEVKSGRLYPAEAKTFKALYIQAAADDRRSPLKEGSRLGAFLENQKKRPAHKLTEEVIDAQANEGFILGLGDSSKSQMEKDAEAQVDEYVATYAPKAKLEVVK